MREAALAPLTGESLRQGRIDLLGRLELGSHGKIGALKTLRDMPGRMRWHLEAWSVAGGGQGGGKRELVLARIRPACEDCLSNALPVLQEILLLARRCGADAALVQRAGDGLAQTAALLSRLLGRSSDPPDAEDVLPELEGYIIEIGLLFDRLRRWLEAGFRADIVQLVARVLQAHEAEVAGAGIEVTTRAGDGLLARIDGEELVFVLDNLVDNAIRAMREMGERRLVIDARAGDGLVCIEVSDTGHGIPIEDQERLIESRFSTRGEGGGLGLHQSRRLLRKYDATIDLVSSAPGRGTTFRVTVPACRPSL
jgi:signal transduction histidine kinase